MCGIQQRDVNDDIDGLLKHWQKYNKNITKIRKQFTGGVIASKIQNIPHDLQQDTLCS